MRTSGKSYDRIPVTGRKLTRRIKMARLKGLKFNYKFLLNQVLYLKQLPGEYYRNQQLFVVESQNL